MIRAKLRSLVNFLISLKKVDKDILHFSDIFDSACYEIFQLAVNITGKYNNEKDLLDASGNASTLGTLVKKLAKIWDDECSIT